MAVRARVCARWLKKGSRMSLEILLCLQWGPTPKRFRRLFFVAAYPYGLGLGFRVQGFGLSAWLKAWSPEPLNPLCLSILSIVFF